ncbi:PPM-type phosphatase domain containing protein [Trema orientale]|uniref:Protein phosphatase n=1 Tax=Trema orientale TaxID=63057 RepID=A0A2P5EJW7_TREOI|nr:PPM-type phosphatase domain containing protein [Trema orientale]
MAVPIFRASVPQSGPASHSFGPALPGLHETSKKRRLLFCVPSELNPVRPALSFCVGTHLIPHPNKVDRGGEDAFFVSRHNGGAIAVADGVSGWAEQNVDPSLFPQELMANFSYLVEDEEVNSDPQILIRKAHAATSSTGSATVIVAILERNGILKIANVGDCGLRVIREGGVVFSSIPQEHYFDCPYQLSSEAVGQTYLDAMVSSLELIGGDTIIMGSDGLFDNVFDDEMISTLARYKDVVEAAKALANLASSHAMDPNFDSPYALEARSRGFDVPWWKKILGRKLTGGKLDDITVVVGQVLSS